MTEQEYMLLRKRLSREVDNLKNALQMFGAFVFRIEMDEIDDIAMDEGELIKALCRKVTADIDKLFSCSK